ncbi:hypothetical protein M2148_002401 [Lachnospiraceae bacterium PF1-4]
MEEGLSASKYMAEYLYMFGGEKAATRYEVQKNDEGEGEL